MGLLIDGKWHDLWYDTDNNQGEFKREQSQFRGQIGSDEFPAEADRYHLYVSLACPWAHRALIFRRLKKLESLISVSVVSPIMLEHGWTFDIDQRRSAAQRKVPARTVYPKPARLQRARYRAGVMG